MATTFQKKIESLNKRFEVVELSKLPVDENPHFDMLQDFKVRPIKGKDGRVYVSSLQDYIRGCYEERGYYIPFGDDFLYYVDYELVWQAKDDNDEDHTRIFLVIDKEARQNEDGKFEPQVAFYFGLSNGLMIDVPEKIASKAEGSLVDSYMQLQYIEDDTERKILENKLYQAIRTVYGATTAKRIFAIAEKESIMYADRMQARESENQTIQSQRTFPAIELTHLVKNMNYKTPADMDAFSLGEYVFWVIIMDKIEKIKAQTGLQFMYLFAADPDMDGDPIAEQRKEDRMNSEEFSEEEIQKMKEDISGTLISYYRNRFGFRIVEGVRLVKPNYDFGCFSMYAPIHFLEANKIANWDSLDVEAKQNLGKIVKGK